MKLVNKPSRVICLFMGKGQALILGFWNGQKGVKRGNCTIPGGYVRVQVRRKDWEGGEELLSAPSEEV